MDDIGAKAALVGMEDGGAGGAGGGGAGGGDGMEGGS